MCKCAFQQKYWGFQALGYSNTQKAVLQHVDEEDKTTVPIWDTGSNYKTHTV